MPYEKVHWLSAEEECEAELCGRCLHVTAFEAATYAVLDSGMQRIGTLTGCTHCDDGGGYRWVCWYCGEDVSGAPARVVEHLSVHGRATP